MNLIAGIVVAVVGLLMVVLSIAGVFPGMTGTGVGIFLAGGLISALSFIKRSPSEDAADMSTAGTLLNIFVSPTETYQALRRNPRWLVAAIIITLLSVTYTNVFTERLTVDRIANYTIDKSKEISFLNDEARNEIEKQRPQAIVDAKNPRLRVGQALTSFVWAVFGYAFLAAIFFLFALAMGGSMTYWQAFSVAVYSIFPVAVLRFILNTIVLFLKDPAEVHPILGQSSLIQDNLGFLVAPGDNPVLYSLLASFSILGFYWVWQMATGMKNAGEKVSGSTAWTAAIVIYIVLMMLGVVMAFMFGNFMS